MKRSRRVRSLLHKNSMDEFRAWLALNRTDVKILEPAPARKHQWEVLRIKFHKYDYPLVFYTRERGHDHITVPGEALFLVREYLTEKHTAKMKADGLLGTQRDG